MSEETEQDSSSGSLEGSVSEDTANDVEAQSSGAEDVKSEEPEETLLDVVQDAFQGQSTEPESSPEVEKEEVAEADPSLEALSQPRPEESEVESVPDAWKDKSIPPIHTHPRFKEVVEEKNRFREDSQQYGKITEFMAQNNLTPDEVAEGFRVMSAIKNDPKRGHEILSGHLGQLAQATGVQLSDELKSKVEEGYLDEESARELSVARSELAHERSLREQAQQRNDQAAVATRQRGITSEVDQWEGRMRQRDPDFDHKFMELNDRLAVMVSERGHPSDGAEALVYAKEAYDTVSARHRGRLPEKPAIRSAVGGKLGGTPLPEPQSLQEAVAVALRARG